MLIQWILAFQSHKDFYRNLTVCTTLGMSWAARTLVDGISTYIRKLSIPVEYGSNYVARRIGVKSLVIRNGVKHRTVYIESHYKPRLDRDQVHRDVMSRSRLDTKYYAEYLGLGEEQIFCGRRANLTLFQWEGSMSSESQNSKIKY